MQLIQTVMGSECHSDGRGSTPRGCSTGARPSGGIDTRNLGTPWVVGQEGRLHPLGLVRWSVLRLHPVGRGFDPLLGLHLPHEPDAQQGLLSPACPVRLGGEVPCSHTLAAGDRTLYPGARVRISLGVPHALVVMELTHRSTKPVVLVRFQAGVPTLLVLRSM